MINTSITRRKFIGQCSTAAAIAALAPRWTFGAAQKEPVSIGTESQLFVDDWIVEKMQGLRRTLHQPEKQGLIKDLAGDDWYSGDCYNGGIVFRDQSGTFHMTYRYMWWDPGLEKTVGADRAHWFQSTVAYATSQDGVHWQKPKLGLLDGPTGFKKQKEFPFEVPIGLSKDNNLACPIEFAYDLHLNGNINVPEHRLLLKLAGQNDTLYYAKDWPDFLHNSNWKDQLIPIPGGRLSPRGFKSICGYDHTAKEWLFTGQSKLGSWIPRGGRDIIRQTSPDLVRWNDAELVLPVAEDELRQPDHWIEYMYLDGYRIGGPRSGAWLGQLQIFDSDRSNPQYEMPTLKGVWRKGTTWLRLVISRDAGKTWNRVCGKEAWLPPHPEDNGYDRLIFGAPPTQVDDELRFYYAAWDGDHLCFNHDGSTFYKDRMRIGRTAWAKLRFDGYVSLDCGAPAGELLSRPFQFEGQGMVVNASIPRGALRTELQNEQGQPIDGFALADSVPLTADGVRLPLRWRSDAPLSKLTGKPIRVRFELSNGSLYSFRFV